jgi:hypothetical protein
MSLATVKLAKVDVPVLIQLIAAALSQVEDPVTLVDSASLIEEDTEAVSEPLRGGELPEVDRIFIELDAEFRVIPECRPGISNELTFWDVLLDLYELALTHLISFCRREALVRLP